MYGQLLSPGEVSPQVSSYAIEEGDRLLLFDPLAVPSEIEERAATYTANARRLTTRAGSSSARLCLRPNFSS